MSYHKAREVGSREALQGEDIDKNFTGGWGGGHIGTFDQIFIVIPPLIVPKESSGRDRNIVCCNYGQGSQKN